MLAVSHIMLWNNCFLMLSTNHERWASRNNTMLSKKSQYVQNFLARTKPYHGSVATCGNTMYALFGFMDDQGKVYKIFQRVRSVGLQICSFFNQFHSCAAKSCLLSGFSWSWNGIMPAKSFSDWQKSNARGHRNLWSSPFLCAHHDVLTQFVFFTRSCNCCATATSEISKVASRLEAFFQPRRL